MALSMRESDGIDSVWGNNAEAAFAGLPLTAPARLDAIVKRLTAMLQGVKTVRASLGDFYNSLDDEQKAQFNMIGQPSTANR
jgi:hypothetical protein